MTGKRFTIPQDQRIDAPFIFYAEFAGLFDDDLSVERLSVVRSTDRAVAG